MSPDGDVLVAALDAVARGECPRLEGVPEGVALAVRRVQARLRRVEEDHVEVARVLRVQTDALAAVGEQLVRDAESSREEFSEAIRAVARPVVPIWRGVLLAVVVGGFDAEQARGLMESVAHRVAEYRAKCVIVDLTAVQELDDGVGERLTSMARTVRLLGSEVIVAGMSASHAVKAAAEGVKLGELRVFSTVERALRTVVALDGRNQTT